MQGPRHPVLCTMVLVFYVLPLSGAEDFVFSSPALTISTEQKTDEPSSSGKLEPHLVPLEADSSDAVTDSQSGALTLPKGFGRRKGDLDEMLRERRIRALVVINPISFFYSQGKPKGLTYETLERFQETVNTKFNTGHLDVKVTFIPMRPEELGPALLQGVGDVIAQGTRITPGRKEQFAFTTPVKKNITQVIVTGKELANVESFDDLVGKDIYVNPQKAVYEDLKKFNELRLAEGKSPLSIKAVDKNLREDDLLEMVNAGLIPATVAMQHRASLWAEVLPGIKLHPQMVVASGGELGWIVRKNNPELKKLLDDFIEEYGEGTSFGNVLLRRYLQNTKWVKAATSPSEMLKFSQYVEYFKRYSAQYSFDYLMIIAQGYQESQLDQNARSPMGAVGIMQVIPKYAAAKPIGIRDVSKADNNILAGVRILNNIVTNYFNDPAIDPVNKTLFTFASYNAGPSRIGRLRKRAAEHGLDPNKWFGNVELEAAEDIGEETVTYVDNIYKYYVAYKLAVDQTKAAVLVR